MKTIIINKKDLKNKNYNNSKLVVENSDEQSIDINNELADFLFSCFKALRENKESAANSINTVNFTLYMPQTIIKKSICLNIIIQRADVQTMKENIAKLIIKALKQINRSYYNIEEFALNVIDDAEDYLNYKIETNCNKVVKVGV